MKSRRKNICYHIRRFFNSINNYFIGKRYPWLIIHPIRTDIKPNPSILWAEPRDGGWNKTFFWQMNEEIRKAAKKTGCFNTLRTNDYKSKYGELRFYVSGFTDEVESIISDYEFLSSNICENCGEPDVGITKGWWIEPICKHCWEKNNNESYEDNVTQNVRMVDKYEYMRYSKENGDQKFVVDVKDKANKIRRRWNFWHPTRRKELSK